MDLKLTSKIIPILPSAIDLFGEWYSKPLIALDNYYHPHYHPGREIKLFNSIEECLDLFDKENNHNKITQGDFVCLLEYVEPHFHIYSKTTRLFDYSDLLDYGENLITNTILEQMDDFYNINFNSWEDIHPELVELKKHGFDIFGTFSIKENSLSLDYNKIQDYCIENEFFTIDELIKLTVYHNYGHWLTKNLSISLDSSDFYFNDTNLFQELFAQLIVAHILHKEGNSDLRDRFDHYSLNELPELYQLYLDPKYSKCITNPDYLVLMLHTARIELGLTNSEIIAHIDIALAKIKNNEDFDKWKSELRKETNNYWREENVFSNDVVGYNIFGISECGCGYYGGAKSLGWEFVP